MTERQRQAAAVEHEALLLGCDEEALRIIRRSLRRHQKRRGNRWSARASRLNKRATRVQAEGRVTARQLHNLVGSYDSRCAYCGVRLDFESPEPNRRNPKRATFDHVKPLGRGGRGDIGNLVPACARCNEKRSRWPDSALGVPAPRRFLIEEE